MNIIRTKQIVKLNIFYSILLVVSLSMSVPFVWMVLTAFKQTKEVFDTSYLLPTKWMWSNFIEVWHQVKFGTYLFNSLFVATAVTVLQILTSSMAAFAFSRLYWRGRDVVFLLYLATLMVPYQLIMVPDFIIMRKAHFINTYWALILPGAFSAYGTFMLRQFMLTIPRDMDDAAAIDGCGKFGIWWQVTMPLSKPALATLAILVSLGNWQSFTWPLIVTYSDHLRTLPVGLSYFQSSYSMDYPLLMAGSTMMILPLIIAFVLGQRYVVEGIQLGSFR